MEIKKYYNIIVDKLIVWTELLVKMLPNFMLAILIIIAVTSLLVGAGIIGLALGFAFQDIATNFIAGFFMAIKRPFRIGQVIHCEGHSGIIRRIGIRTTEIRRYHDSFPNKDIGFRY